MDDKTRVQKLAEYQVLDTLPEKEFDDIVDVASAICNTPISQITLLDSHRQWFKANAGTDKTETPIEYSFCYHAIQEPDEVMVVPDSWIDQRFTDNPLAHGDGPVRFYAGAPLITDGVPIGTLCVIDHQPRTFTKEQERILKLLAERVVKQLELRKENLRQKDRAESEARNAEVSLQRMLEHQQQYSHALEEMLFTVSHKLRKPVANIHGLINLLNTGPLTEQKIKECTPYFKTFTDELDGYIHEVNDFLEKRHIEINTGKK